MLAFVHWYRKVLLGSLVYGTQFTEISPPLCAVSVSYVSILLSSCRFCCVLETVLASSCIGGQSMFSFAQNLNENYRRIYGEAKHQNYSYSLSKKKKTIELLADLASIVLGSILNIVRMVLNFQKRIQYDTNNFSFLS